MGARTPHQHVGRAYFYVRQPPIEYPHGRAIFARIPSGRNGLGAEHGLCFEEVQGSALMALLVARDVPGLLNAGVMWAGEFTRFLLELDFTQTIVDRRLFFMSDEEGRAVLLGTFVDDCNLVVRSESLAAGSNEEWEKKSSDPPGVGATARDFLGLRYDRVSADVIENSCGRALGDLDDKLTGVNLKGFGPRRPSPARGWARPRQRAPLGLRPSPGARNPGARGVGRRPREARRFARLRRAIPPGLPGAADPVCVGSLPREDQETRARHLLGAPGGLRRSSSQARPR